MDPNRRTIRSSMDACIRTIRHSRSTMGRTIRHSRNTTDRTILHTILRICSTMDYMTRHPSTKGCSAYSSTMNCRCCMGCITDIVAIAKACEEAGADGICLINTLLGMRIDTKRRRPVIANKMGGFSGPAIFPVAVRMVYQVANACSIPVMGCGGVESASDVIEMMMAGATAVQVGAANLKDPYACKRIIEDLPAEMERLGIERLSDIIGIVK